jgi:hypothetical protein
MTKDLSLAMKGYIRFLCWLRYEEHPNFNRALAGLYQLLWTHFCGYGWRSAWRMAMGYWTPRRPR